MKIFKNTTIGLCLFIALFSCKKDNLNIGADISGNPGSVSAAVIDTFNIVTYSKIEDSVITSQRSSPLLGVINSAETGISKSSLFASFVPDSLDRNFPSANFEIDSFYLQIHIIGVYGNNINQEFDVYKIESIVNSDSTYYNFDSLEISTKIGSFIINQSDSGVYKFNLDSSNALNLISSSNSEYQSNLNFQSFFSGIYITPRNTPTENDGAIYSLNRTGISLHLSFSTTDGMNDDYDLNLKYLIEEDNNIFARFNHDLEGSDLELVINDSALGQNAFYVQGMAGAYAEIKFPEIQDWFNNDSSNYLVNQFELKILVEENSTFSLPEKLMITYLSSTGIRLYTTAELYALDDTYTFTIAPTEVNIALENKQFNKMDFQLANPFPGSEPDQVKIFGPNSNNSPILKISFTKY